MPEEIWKTTKALTGFYEVSSLGRIRRSGGGKGARVGHVLKTVINPKSGYEQVNVTIRGKGKLLSINRAVCEAFHGRPWNGQEAHHKNFDKTNNREENLAWLSHSENVMRDYRAGRR